jgi:hypothetical protein
VPLADLSPLKILWSWRRIAGPCVTVLCCKPTKKTTWGAVKTPTGNKIEYLRMNNSRMSRRGTEGDPSLSCAYKQPHRTAPHGEDKENGTHVHDGRRHDALVLSPGRCPSRFLCALSAARAYDAFVGTLGSIRLFRGPPHRPRPSNSEAPSITSPHIRRANVMWGRRGRAAVVASQALISSSITLLCGW